MQCIPRHPNRHTARNPNPIHHDPIGRRHPCRVVTYGIVQAHGLVDDGVEEGNPREVAVGKFSRESLAEGGGDFAVELGLVGLVGGEVVEGVGEDGGDGVSFTMMRLVSVMGRVEKTYVAPTKMREASAYRMLRLK